MLKIILFVIAIMIAMCGWMYFLAKMGFALFALVVH
jgi:hypothetical protein